MLGTSNPVLKEKAFESESQAASRSEGVMTISGTVNKTLILLAFLIAGAGVEFYLFLISSALAIPFMFGGMILGLILAITLIFKKAWAPYLASAYAFAQGFVVGGISIMMESLYPGIAIQALGLTIGTAFSLLGLYRTGWIQVTDRFRTGVVSATMAIALVYMGSFILNFFGIDIGILHSVSLLSIGVSLLVVGIAAMNLVLDFDTINRGAQTGAPKYMEWFGAFGLMVTLIWLYIELIKLLSKLAGRRNQN